MTCELTRQAQQAAIAGQSDIHISRTHDLKTDPEAFDAADRGDKTHEIRFNDRDFKVGDLLQLLETRHTGEQMRAGAPLEFTGRKARRVVSHIQEGYGLAPGWVILSFARAASAALPGPLTALQIEDMVAEAMGDAWADFVGDTGCFPDDFTLHPRRRLSFTPGRWAHIVGEWVAQRLNAAAKREHARSNQVRTIGAGMAEILPPALDDAGGRSR
jgi:hypothetical protein